MNIMNVAWPVGNLKLYISDVLQAACKVSKHPGGTRTRSHQTRELGVGPHLVTVMTPTLAILLSIAMSCMSNTHFFGSEQLIQRLYESRTGTHVCIEVFCTCMGHLEASLPLEAGDRQSKLLSIPSATNSVSLHSCAMLPAA